MSPRAVLVNVGLFSFACLSMGAWFLFEVGRALREALRGVKH